MIGAAASTIFRRVCSPLVILFCFHRLSYRHFSNKEELATEAFDYTWEAARNLRWLHEDETANGIEKLKLLIANFVDHRSPIAGGCPILNPRSIRTMAIRSFGRVAKALRSWLSRLQTIVEQARERGETRSDVDLKTVAILIVASLEGALMMSRRQRNDEALRSVQAHLNGYLDDEVAASSRCTLCARRIVPSFETGASDSR